MKSAKQTITNTAFVTLGILSAGFGLQGFLLSSRLIDDGMTSSIWDGTARVSKRRSVVTPVC